MSKEILKRELDIFKGHSFQGSIESSNLIQFRPINSISDATTIEFDIPFGSDEYIDTTSIYLFVKAKLQERDGTNYEATGLKARRFSIINHPLNTMWDQVDVYLGSTLISQSSKGYQYLAFIEALTNRNIIPTIITYMWTSGFFSIFSTDYTYFDQPDLGEPYKMVQESRIFTLYGKIHGSLFTCPRFLLNGVSMHLKFIKCDDAFVCMGKPTQALLGETNPTLKLLDCSLFVRKVKLSTNLLNAHGRALQMSRAIYPIERPIIKVLNLPSGQSSFVMDNVILGQLPNKIIFGLVTNVAYNGHKEKDPLRFQHFDLTYLTININGESFPKVPYTPDFRDDHDLYQREYYDFLDNIGATKTLSQPPIDYRNYKKGYCLYAFNLNCDFKFGDEYINIPREGYLTIEMKFRSNLTEALKLILYAVFDNTIKIDQNRNVTLDY